MLRGETYYYNDSEVLYYEVTLRSSSSSSSTSSSSSSVSSSSKSSSSVSLPFRYQDDPWNCYDELSGSSTSISSVSSSSSSESSSSSSDSSSSRSSSSNSSSSSSSSSSESSSSLSSSSSSESSSSSTSCYVSPDDDFTGTDGDPPNVQRWIDVQNDGNLASIQDNKLNFYAGIGATNKEAIYESRFTISGDFDIRIDFSDWGISGPSVESSHINFIVRRESDDELLGLLRKRRKAPAAQYGSDGLDVTLDYAGSDDLSGKFRITRISGQIKTYVWDIDDWKWDGFTTGRVVTNNDNSDVYVQLHYKKDNDHSLEVDLDNFDVYSGLVNCMTSSSSQSSSSSSSESGGADFRITEELDGRLTEEGDVRILESVSSSSTSLSSSSSSSGVLVTFRITEELDGRVTEGGDDRVLESSSLSSSSSSSESFIFTFRLTEVGDDRVTEEVDDRIIEP